MIYFFELNVLWGFITLKEDFGHFLAYN